MLSGPPGPFIGLSRTVHPLFRPDNRVNLLSINTLSWSSVLYQVCVPTVLDPLSGVLDNAPT